MRLIRGYRTNHKKIMKQKSATSKTFIDFEFTETIKINFFQKFPVNSVFSRLSCIHYLDQAKTAKFGISMIKNLNCE